MEYPYIEVTPHCLAPVVPVQFWTGERWFYSMGYVDSGASLSVFQMKVSKSLGLSKKEGKSLVITAADGSKMSLLVYTMKVKFSDLAFSARVGFSEQLGVGFNIIGRTSFFERFRICFNDQDRKVTTLRLF